MSLEDLITQLGEAKCTKARTDCFTPISNVPKVKIWGSITFDAISANVLRLYLRSNIVFDADSSTCLRTVVEQTPSLFSMYDYIFELHYQINA